MILAKNNLQSQTVRNSGVELLKIFAILAICLSHCTQTMEQFVDFQEPTFNIQLLILRLFRFDGQIGNLIFIISSSYFLFGKKNVKREKILNLLFDSQFISIIILIGFCVLGSVISFNIKYSTDLLLSNIFPDLYENVWFVPTYIILYIVHPVIDLVINALSQRKHLALSILLFLFYSLYGLFDLSQYSFFPPLFRIIIIYPVQFAAIYFIVAYIKIYMNDFITDKNKNLKIVLIGICTLMVCVLLKNFLGLKLTYFEKYPEFNDLFSFILFPMVLSLFNLCLNFNFKNKTINYLSSCSLFVYCIHENLLVRGDIRPKLYEFLIEKSGGVNHYLLNVLIMFLVVVIVAFTAAIIYKHTIHKITAKLSIKADSLICKTLYKVTSKLMKESSNEKEALQKFNR